MKLSFPSATREAEDKIILDARQLAESSDKWKWVLNHLHGRLRAHLNVDYEERVIRVTIQEKLHPITELEDPIHEWLYEARLEFCIATLSEGNLMFRRIDGKVYGVLNDFDLLTVRLRNTALARNHFMALDLLNKRWNGGHMYRHDLESLFYIMLCLALNAPSFGKKRHFSVRPFFKGFEPWLQSIYAWLRTGDEGRPDEDDDDLAFDWEPSMGKWKPLKTRCDSD
ncbi:hypothetical protein BT96DRAFT_920391 [Gymnopus androsaceus JB14]|uniref:Fungal-type protein kinase domain-containing protein n=1 Tax=Gymnopus androsaceus JB14 TaxID=1447944 RepID=A0A6A4HPS9_9AGAR|nr:hypothetical protein BT96DRAFT_920391 [Gymnopus androsaceus JB14]